MRALHDAKVIEPDPMVLVGRAMVALETDLIIAGWREWAGTGSLERTFAIDPVLGRV